MLDNPLISVRSVAKHDRIMNGVNGVVLMHNYPSPHLGPDSRKCFCGWHGMSYHEHET